MEVWSRSEDVVWRTAPEYLVVSTVAGQAVEIHGPAESVWKLLDYPRSSEELLEALTSTHGDRAAVESGLIRLLSDLESAGYVRRTR